MLKSQRKPFETPYDLLKVYRAAYEKTKYLQDADEKILALSDVINYCASSKICVESDNTKRNQVLFWTYSNIGDFFLEKNRDEPSEENYVYALEYFKNAIEFINSYAYQKSVLEKMVYIYNELQDEKSAQKTKEQIVSLEPEEMKRQALVELANGTDDIKLQTEYLENALNFVMYENVSVMEKCKNTLEICSRLLTIYELTNNMPDYERIKNLQKSTLELLN